MLSLYALLFIFLGNLSLIAGQSNASTTREEENLFRDDQMQVCKQFNDNCPMCTEHPDCLYCAHEDRCVNNSLFNDTASIKERMIKSHCQRLTAVCEPTNPILIVSIVIFCISLYLCLFAAFCFQQRDVFFVTNCPKEITHHMHSAPSQSINSMLNSTRSSSDLVVMTERSLSPDSGFSFTAGKQSLTHNLKHSTSKSSKLDNLSFDST